MGLGSPGEEAELNIGHSIHECAGEGNDGGRRQGGDAPLRVGHYAYSRRSRAKRHEAGEQIIRKPAGIGRRPGKRGQKGRQGGLRHGQDRARGYAQVHERRHERGCRQGKDRRGKV
jgi:hypothetical protein